MEIKTVYPVIIDGQQMSPSDYYSNAAGTSAPETYMAGDLSIQTSYPVVLDGSDLSPVDYYASADGTPSMAEQAAAKKKGLFWDNVKGQWANITNNPGAQFALEKVAEYLKLKQSGGFTPSTTTGGGTKDTLPDATLTDNSAKPMTMTTKIVIGVGIVAVLGFVGYGIFSNSKK